MNLLQCVFEGLPDLQELNMYGNKVVEIVVPTNPTLLSKLETLDLGYNIITYLPNELDQLKALKTLKVTNNLLAKVPMRICDMDLKRIDVSSNPVTEPPYETCERGIGSMRRYWQSIRMEEVWLPSPFYLR
jgi:Leucine-rich repeat (LRR) protein